MTMVPIPAYTRAGLTPEQRFVLIEQSILSGESSSISWSHIDFHWVHMTKKSGGTFRRKATWGRIIYSIEVAHNHYQQVTREEALAELRKPLGLRQAMVEANTMIECNMCGLVVVGEDAMDPYRGITVNTFDATIAHKKQWGLMFWKMGDNNEPMALSICPACMQRIANGEFRDDKESPASTD